jgi:hypothetical protein
MFYCSQDGTDDRTFHALFKPIMAKVMESFQPGAIVMQCGECGQCHTASQPARRYSPLEPCLWPSGQNLHAPFVHYCHCVLLYLLLRLSNAFIHTLCIAGADSLANDQLGCPQLSAAACC